MIKLISHASSSYHIKLALILFAFLPYVKMAAGETCPCYSKWFTSRFANPALLGSQQEADAFLKAFKECQDCRNHMGIQVDYCKTKGFLLLKGKDIDSMSEFEFMAYKAIQQSCYEYHNDLDFRYYFDACYQHDYISSHNEMEPMSERKLALLGLLKEECEDMESERKDKDEKYSLNPDSAASIFLTKPKRGDVMIAMGGVLMGGGIPLAFWLWPQAANCFSYQSQWFIDGVIVYLVGAIFAIIPLIPEIGGGVLVGFGSSFIKKNADYQEELNRMGIKPAAQNHQVILPILSVAF
jgi:hypothetical protein